MKIIFMSFFRFSSMSANIEIKAKVPDQARLVNNCDSLNNCQYIEDLHQHDIFYNVSSAKPSLRLKLRKVKNHNRFMLISYDRPDTDGDKLSSYTITRFPDEKTADDLDITLKHSLGAKNEVKKVRKLYMYKDETSGINTRIHIDNVEGLGQFMELEIQVDSTEDKIVKRAEEISTFLRTKLEICDDNLISGAYADHLKK